jgi:hypothetical protein
MGVGLFCFGIWSQSGLLHLFLLSVLLSLMRLTLLVLDRPIIWFYGVLLGYLKVVAGLIRFV